MAPEKRQRGFPWPGSEREERGGKRTGSKEDVVMRGRNRARGRHLCKADRMAGGTQGGWRAESAVGGRQAGQHQGSRVGGVAPEWE